jgi:cytosine/adenosine deaminase-related metal-dependent hydrolase
MGTTTLGEIAQPDCPIEAVEASDVAGEVYVELIAPTTNRVDAALELARRHLHVRSSSGSWRRGLSPHAPYSVHPALLRRVVDLSAVQRVPIAMHLAETADELELLQTGSGRLRGLLEELGAWDLSAFPGNKRPMDYLQVLSGAHRVLVIHGNYLNDEEISFLAQNGSTMSVVYCPRTHAFFEHSKYPLAKMLAAGATVAVGTDSRASSPDLSVLNELRHVARTHADLKGETVLSLGTLHGARALGRDHEVGSLERNKLADLAIVALPDRDSSDPYELVFDSDLPVVGRCWRGEAGRFVRTRARRQNK